MLVCTRLTWGTFQTQISSPIPQIQSQLVWDCICIFNMHSDSQASHTKNMLRTELILF